jgi:hypothetical protein
VKGRYERRRLRDLGDYHSTWILGRSLLDLGELDGEILSWGVGQRISTGGTDLLEVLGTGARISIWYPGARKLS